MQAIQVHNFAKGKEEMFYNPAIIFHLYAVYRCIKLEDINT
jgi:hypothetical protein